MDEMNHKYSTYAIVILLLIAGTGTVLSVFTSEDIDEVCSTNDSVLYKANGDWSCGSRLLNTPVSFEIYDAEPARGAESDIHGGMISLATAQDINTGNNGSANQGIGKMLIVPINATDSSGTIYITGTKIDRVTGVTTAGYTDSININGIGYDYSTTDGNGNTVHNFSETYLTGVWFTGAVTFWTTDLDMDDVDIYHISFEQLNDQDGTIINTFDANLVTTNVNAEYDAYLYKLIKDDNGRVNISHFGELHVGNLGVSPIANRYYRLRKGNLAQAINGTRDGIFLDIHYSNSPAYVEDMTIKVWGTQRVIIE